MTRCRESAVFNVNLDLGPEKEISPFVGFADRIIIALFNPITNCPGPARYGDVMKSKTEHRPLFHRRIPVAFLFAFLSIADSLLWGAEVRLKNGMTLRGDFLVMDKLGRRAVGLAEMKQIKDQAIIVRNIGRIDNGWQRVYFPLQQRQIVGDAAIADLAAPRISPIPLPRPNRTQQNMLVSSFGTITYVGPFDEFGKRRLTIAAKKGPMDVFQAITEVYPDHVMVESTNCDWKLGLPLKSIPIETLEPMLKRQIKKDDPVAHFALVRFYVMAEYYQQAFEELDAISRNFPEQAELVAKQRELLMNSFGKEILRRLGHRQQAGQHQLAETFAKKLLTQPLTGSVLVEVKKYIQRYEQARQSIEQAKLLLSDWQARLNDAERELELQPLRSEIKEQLDFETLPRLDAFLKAEADKQYEPAQRLGLAYSGWVLGSANAIPDLDQTLRIWEARDAAIEYLRSDAPGRQAELIEQLRKSEGISPKIVLNLVPQLPAILDASDIEPGVPHRIETEGANPVAYSVVLPAEYSPHHRYPLMIALRARNRSTDQTLAVWAGDASQPDAGHQRGYIVIAPEYAEKTQGEHTYGAPAHACVLDCLIDAKKRFAVDSDRVFLAGHAMGADAAFDIGMAHPDEFAGVLPIGGNALQYCTYSWPNGSHTAWYIVGKGYDSKDNRDNTSNAVFDNMMVHGAKFDFMLVEYLGRNGENLIDDFSRMFDWMDLHTRRPQPKEFEIRSLRKTDHRFFWLTANGLPRDYILPVPAGAAQKIIPMEIEARITPGNTVNVKALTDNITLRLSPELVDFDNKLVVRIGMQKKYNVFLKPDSGVLLEELQLRGDRKRLPLAVFTPGRERPE